MRSTPASQRITEMILATFHADWIANTRSPYFRSRSLSALDTALRNYCAGATPVTTQALITAWDNWQLSKVLTGGWWNTERSRFATQHIVIRLSNEIQLLKPAGAVARGTVCYDTPHLDRMTTLNPPIAFAMHANSVNVWQRSVAHPYSGDSFIGITQRSTGTCHIVATYQAVVPPVVPAALDSVVFGGAPRRTLADVQNAFGVPPAFGGVGRRYIVGQPGPIDGYYHGALLNLVGVPAADALGWALQGNVQNGGGQFRFVSSRNLGVFDLGHPAGHEARDLPPAWCKAISDCVGAALNLRLAANLEYGASGPGHQSFIRQFTC